VDVRIPGRCGTVLFPELRQVFTATRGEQKTDEKKKQTHGGSWDTREGRAAATGLLSLNDNGALPEQTTEALHDLVVWIDHEGTAQKPRRLR